MKTPIPSYLIAIVAGDIAQKSVGTKTYVITEPVNLDSFATELSDLENYLNTIQTYIGTYK